MSNEFKNNKKDTAVGDKTSAKEDVNSKNSNVETQKNKNAIGLVNFFTNEKFKRSLGVIFLTFSVYLFIAFFSFFFTWQKDQDKVLSGFWNLISSSEIKIENWLGKLGAMLSHSFITNGFGIGAFIWIVILFVIGFKFLFNKTLIPISKLILNSLVVMILSSISLGYIFKENYFYLGGVVGLQTSKWLIATIGNIGTALALIAIVSIALIFYFNHLFQKSVFQKLIPSMNNISKEEIFEEKKKEDEENEIDLMHEKATIEFDRFSNLKNPNEPSLLKKKVNEKSTLENSIKAEKVQLEITNSNNEKVENKEEVVFEIEPPKIETILEKEEIVEDKSIPSIDEFDTQKIVSIPTLLEELGEYDPKLDLSNYEYPPVTLLDVRGSDNIVINNEELTLNKDRIIETLKNYSIEISKISATIGPTVTLYEINPAPGVRISKIKNLEDDIALSLSALGIRIIAPIPGKGTIGIEVPNQKPEIVSMRSIIASEKFQKTDFELPIALGKTISNEIFIADLAKMPHLLMAGATGQGKSVGLNAILVSLLFKKHPSQIKFVLVDPKKVELTLFNIIEKHFLAKLPDSSEAIITDTKKVIYTLNSLCIEMDNRYELLKDAQVRNLKEYNVKFISRRLNPKEGHRYLPYIVLVVDEFADLIMTAGKEVEMPIARLAQLARAIGIHLVIATQRPSVNIITGTIKANFPARIAFRVSSKIDSRTILDGSGADQLIGRGDMLLSTGNDLIRIQCAFVDTPEVERIAEFIGKQRSYPHAYELPEFSGEEAGEKKEEVDLSQRDQYFVEAARIIVQHQQGSTSLIQRRLKLGYNRAGRIVDQLEAAGIVGPNEGSKARQVFFPTEQSLEDFLQEKNLI
jgi:DNA segregation ATPase FtsK/SpoIIIE, S-DNA-T family